VIFLYVSKKVNLCARPVACTWRWKIDLCKIARQYRQWLCSCTVFFCSYSNQRCYVEKASSVKANSKTWAKAETTIARTKYSMKRILQYRSLVYNSDWQESIQCVTIVS